MLVRFKRLARLKLSSTIPEALLKSICGSCPNEQQSEELWAKSSHEHSVSHNMATARSVEINFAHLHFSNESRYGIV
jgi:hypothetical protein